MKTQKKILLGNAVLLILIFMSLGVITPSGAVSSANMKLEIEWEVFFGESDDDEAMDLIQTSDDGFAVFVCSEDAITEESYGSLVKFDANGQQEWKTSTGSVYRYQQRSLVQTADEEYVISNAIRYGDWKRDLFLHKRNSTGHVIWNNTIGAEGDDWAVYMISTEDGGFACVGGTSSYGPHEGIFNAWLVKTNSLGVPEWNRTFGGDQSEIGLIGLSLVQTIDGGYACVVTIEGENAKLLIKTNSTGQMEWNKTFAGLKGVNRVLQIADGSFVIAGAIEQPVDEGDNDFWLLKTDPNGNHIWNTTHGRHGSLKEEEFRWHSSLIQTIDNGYLLAGSTFPQTNNADILFVKTDANGIQEWTVTLDKSSEDGLKSIIQLSDGKFVIAGKTKPSGKTDTDMWLFKAQIVEETTTPSFELGVIVFSLTLLLIISRKRRP